MSERFKIADLKAGHLDNKCLTILAKISRALAHKGIIIKLQDNDVLKKVDYHARKSSDKELTILHAQLKVALKDYVHSPRFKEKLSLILYDYRHPETENDRAK